MAGRATRRAPWALLAALTALALAAPAASATKTISPTSHDFGSKLLQSSTTRDFTLTVACTPGPVCLPDPLVPLVIATGDFSQTNNCPLVTLLGISEAGETCTITVRFTPTATGVRTGTLTSGIGGPAAQLTGRGIGPVILDTPEVRGTCAKGRGKGAKGKGKKGKRSAKKCKGKKPRKKPKKKK